jgi:integrase/recombinase XerC
MNNWSDSVFRGIPAGEQEPGLVDDFLANNDFSLNTQRAFAHDLGTFAHWFVQANQEPFRISRVTTGDVSGFRDHLRRDREQAVSSVNRALVTVRRLFAWLVEEGHLTGNPAQKVKELRRQQLAPKGLERAQVRRLFREVELRDDVRANAIFHTFLFTGGRVGDLVDLELDALMIGERSGTVIFKNGKGGKQRSVPLPSPARRALQSYLESRPPVQSRKVFVGERGPLTDRGVRKLCDKYSAICGYKIHPHLLRHSMAHRYLEDNGNDLVGLAQILGHESLNTTSRYCKQTQEQLSNAAERLNY